MSSASTGSVDGGAMAFIEASAPGATKMVSLAGGVLASMSTAGTASSSDSEAVFAALTIGASTTRTRRARMAIHPLTLSASPASHRRSMVRRSRRGIREKLPSSMAAGSKVSEGLSTRTRGR